MAEAIADISSTYEAHDKFCPKILREDGLAGLEPLVVILANYGR